MYYARTEALKAGYLAEMGALHDKLTEAKAGLEEFYAKRIDDKDVVDEKKAEYETLMSGGDAAVLSFTSGVKLVKAALVPWLHLYIYIYIFVYKYLSICIRIYIYILDIICSPLNANSHKHQTCLS